MSGEKPRRLSALEWLSYGPFLAQIIVTRRCNLTCAYCTEYDLVSEPVPFETLRRRMMRLRELRCWALSLMGGEPTLHPDLLKIVSEMRTLGFRRRMLTTNGLLLNEAMVEGLNRNGLTDMTISVDGVTRNEVTIKVLDTLKKRLEMVAKTAKFPVVLNAVVGSAPREEVLEVAEFARTRGFVPRILLLHDSDGQFRLSVEQRAVYAEVKHRLGREAAEAHDYRERLLQDGVAPYKCRSGSRYLYIDENGLVRWCATTMDGYGKSLEDYTLDDLKENFYEGKSCSDHCTVGCVRTASAYDEWRGQRPASAAKSAV